MTRSSLPILESPAAGSPYVGYSYSYPHKTAYRSLTPTVPLSHAWANEGRDALFLYLHVPFCEHRCGFCNLFTQANPESELVARYLEQLQVEAEVVTAAVAEPRFARLAIGGGTPTFLEPHDFERLLSVVTQCGVDPGAIPVSVEVSPATIDADKLQLMKQFGTDRISIGIQSFNERDAHRMGRPQKPSEIDAALELITDQQFPVLNLDLIYGGEGQTLESWLDSVRRAAEWQAEEIYLYPLYVRPLTGLGRLSRQWDDHRTAAYRVARDWLLESGYRQVSMRMFARTGTPGVDGPAYCCQSDGMVGLGCGARSYTRELHYSTEFAVGRSSVGGILADYVERDSESFAVARHGFRMTVDEQRRRFAIQSILQVAGIDRNDYRMRFGDDVLHHIPELSELPEAGLAYIAEDSITLTDTGLERSDAIGPWLYSDHVRGLMNDHTLA